MNSTYAPALEARAVECTFSLPGRLLSRQSRTVQAVSGVDLTVHAGETVGLVGESGCGKSTLARVIVGLERARSGSVHICGTEPTRLGRRAAQAARRNVQLVFQDPYSSLNPSMTIFDLLSEGWRVHPGVVQRERWDARVGELLDMVGLSPDHATRKPKEFSGGQLQRICIARALSVEPKLLVADEAVSALDVSVQAQVLNLLDDLRHELNLGVLFISHDLSVVQHLCDRVAVMYLGRIVESGRTQDVFSSPHHPYTQMLLTSIPDLYPWQRQTPTTPPGAGEVPSPIDPPAGCRFRTRCPIAEPSCGEAVPTLAPATGEGDHLTACWRTDVTQHGVWSQEKTIMG